MARILQFNFEDKELKYLDRVSGEDIARLARELHCNIVVVFARDAWGRAYYESRTIRKTAALGLRDFIRELVEAAGRLNLRVVVMVGHTTDPELYSANPGWAQRRLDGSVIHMDTNPSQEVNPELRWPLMCLNSPFLERVLKEVSEVLAYGVDGVFLDSFRYMPDLEKACFCESCRRLHKDETGRDLPSTEDWDSLAYRESFLWRYRVNVKAIERIYNSVKSLNKSALLVYNSHPAGWKGRANTIVEMARDYLDVVFAECSEADYQPPGFLAEMVKLTQALSGGKRVWATRNVFHMALTTTPTTPIAIKQGVREIFAAGGDPMILVFSSAFVQASSYRRPVSEVMAEVEKLEEFMEGVERVRYAGVVYSNRSRDWAGRGDPRHVTDEVRGLYYALAYNGFPVDFVSDSQLDEGRIEGFAGILLGNTASVSERAAAQLETFVRKGGGLVASFLTSKLDEMGRNLEEFQLSKLLGVSYRGMLEASWSYVVVTDEHPVVKGVPDPIIIWGDFDRLFRDRRVPPSLAWHAVVEPIEDSQILGRVALAAGEYGYEYENGRSPPLLGLETSAPAIVAGVHRKTVYFSGQLGRLYWRLGLPHHEALIEGAVKWVAGEPPLRMASSGLVLFEPYVRSGQLVIHLVNLTFDRRIILRGNIDDPTMWHSTVETVMPPRETVPVEVTIEIKGFEPRKAKSALTGRMLDLVDGKLCLKLGEYEMIIVDL
ncbi:MAG: beta-galactosidase trimerization domain-containing protein [Thermofilaceae archaeon]